MDPGDVNLALKRLTPAQEKALRMAHGIGCERPHTRGEIIQEFESHQYSRHRTSEVIKQANTTMRRLLGDNYRRELAGMRGLQTLIRLPDSKEIAEVCFATEKLVDEGRIEHATLLALTPRQFEEFIAEIWSRFGYTVELTARTRDGGRDVVAIKRAEAEVRYLIECKRYSPVHKVGVQFVRALYGVKNDEKATKAFMATTSTFTSGAVVLFEKHRWELEGRDFEGVRQWIRCIRDYHRRENTELWVPDPERM
jgi:hypothetical protein